MKQVRRPAVEPPTLRPNGNGGIEAARRAGLFRPGQPLGAVNQDFATHWGEADVRGALWAMHGRSCVYCDRYLPDNDRGDVEHYRPKNLYWWLAYTFENFFLSCTICNTSYKRNQFPLFPPDHSRDYSGRAQLGAEDRMLLDPIVDPTEQWLRVDYDVDFDVAMKKGFRIEVASNLAERDEKRCEATLKFFRINRDGGLMRARIVAIHMALNAAKAADAGIEEFVKDVKSRAVRFNGHSFAVRQLLQWRQKDSYIPTPDEEVSWLVDDLVGILELANEALKKDRKLQTEADRRDRAAWALAVLMKDPPALSVAAIGEKLKLAGVLEMVEPLYQQL